MYEPCLNCGSYSFKEKYYFKDSERGILICQNCGLVQVNPRNKMFNFVDHESGSVRKDKLSKLFNLMKRGMGQTLKEVMEKEVVVKKEYFKAKVKNIKKYNNSGKLLDVGCAQGVFLAACSDSHFELFGVEPSKYTYEEALKIAQNSTIYNCTIFEAQFPENKFDVVTLINTLEHLLNPKETIAEIYRILKPGGLLLIETPNIDHWIPRLLGKNWVQLLVPDHVVFFSKKILVNVLEEIGFEAREIKSSYKRMSIRLLLFHLSRYIGFLAQPIMKINERIGFANKTILLPQWDEMILFSIKTDKKSKIKE